MITAEDFKKLFMPDGNGNFIPEVDLPKYDLVYESENVKHKLVISTEVYKYFGQYFGVTYTRDNTGYWSDGESYPAEVAEVFPYTFIETRYK
jgi:hypothetical protein